MRSAILTATNIQRLEKAKAFETRAATSFDHPKDTAEMLKIRYNPGAPEHELVFPAGVAADSFLTKASR